MNNNLIAGIGIDIVQVKRMRCWIGQPGLLERYFHFEELSVVFSRGAAAAHSLAGRFAAKEAFGKALGTGLAGIALKDIMVANNQNGKPEFILFDTALNALKKNGGGRLHLSLTHDHDNAVAMVVLEAV